jgi:hypothetical protein
MIAKGAQLLLYWVPPASRIAGYRIAEISQVVEWFSACRPSADQSEVCSGRGSRATVRALLAAQAERYAS